MQPAHCLDSQSLYVQITKLEASCKIAVELYETIKIWLCVVSNTQIMLRYALQRNLNYIIMGLSVKGLLYVTIIIQF